MSETAIRKISKNENSEKPKSVTLTIHKHDGMFFWVRIGACSTISGWNKAEILEAKEKYKSSLKIIFKTKALEKMFQTHVDDPQYS